MNFLCASLFTLYAMQAIRSFAGRRRMNDNAPAKRKSLRRRIVYMSSVAFDSGDALKNILQTIYQLSAVGSERLCMPDGKQYPWHEGLTVE